MSLATNIANLATRIATELKALRTLVNGNTADLSSLTTTTKSNLVAAVNEVKVIADAAAGGGVSINDEVTNTTSTWSSQKITDNEPTWGTIAGKPDVIGAGATAAAARTAIDAAEAGHTHESTDITDFAAAVDVRVQGIVGAAPEALDTLAELATALGDDADFAGTMTTALGNRVRVDAPQSFTGPQQSQGRGNIGAAAAADVGDTSTNFVTTFETGLV